MVSGVCAGGRGLERVGATAAAAVETAGGGAMYESFLTTLVIGVETEKPAPT